MATRRVSELMNPDPVCLRPDMTVDEAELKLADRNAPGAPVVDETGRAVGFVSQTDLVRVAHRRRTAAESGRFHTDVDDYRDLRQLPTDGRHTLVEKVMDQNVQTVTRETGVAIAANIMRELRLHQLVVTDRGRVVGVIGSFDLLRVVEEAC
ncbi:MAG: CBS domain-containing protein [Proteobacteria bacterium]|nr:CBS domain-containing protein [Pseudomonadota bacterium]